MDRKEPARAAERAAGRAGSVWKGPFAVDDPATLERVFDLRRKIWLNEPSLVDTRKVDIEAVMRRDAHDDHGFHWIILSQERMVAAARLCIHKDAREVPYYEEFRHLAGGIEAPIASMNALVVVPEMRRHGLTAPLTEVRIAAAREQGARSVMAIAAPNRVETLREFGFTAIGETMPVPGYLVPFVVMHLTLKQGL